MTLTNFQRMEQIVKDRFSLREFREDNTNLDALGEFLSDLAQVRGYYWDKKYGQYRSRWNNRLVKESTVRNAVEKYNSAFVAQNIESLTDRFIDGKMDLATWQRRMAVELKNSHLINTVVGKGGRANMTFSDWGKLGARLKAQYKWLNGFAQDIYSGTMTPGQIRYRSSMYAKSVRSSYFAGLTQAKKEAGLTQERRYTTSEKPCDVCVSLEARGWQPIGSLPDPGTQCLGMTNCHCEKLFKAE